jgi:hypothetical protein
MTKRSRLATGHFCPAFGWSGYQMIGTGIRLNSKARHGSAFGWVLNNYLEFLQALISACVIPHYFPLSFVCIRQIHGGCLNLVWKPNLL